MKSIGKRHFFDVSKLSPKAMPEYPSETEAQKEALRQKMRALRAAQPPKLALERSLAAQRMLLDSPLWRNARQVALYAALPEEMSTKLLLHSAWQCEKLVWLPAITNARQKIMEFRPCANSQMLEKGPMGILQPSKQAAGNDAHFDPDLMILPGLAFDLSGYRLGYGGGYYDRFLASALPCPRIGLCFSFQIAAHLPHNAFDAPVNAICSEEGLLWI